MKKLLGGAVALAIVAAIIVASVAGSAATKHTARREREATTTTEAPSTSRSPSTSPSTSTTSTTVKPKPKTDPLAGVTMLGFRGREIFAIDAQGNEMRRLVIVFERRRVETVQMTGDHHTIWYVTAPANPIPGDDMCSDVVRLDLAANKRTVIAHADSVSVSADGSRVALRGVYADDQCKNGRTGIGQSVVLDVATGAQSSITGGGGDLVISPGGQVVVSTHCTDDSNGCRIHLMRADVPDHLGAPLTLHQINDPKLSFWGLTQRPDGLYAIVDTHPQECDCNGSGVDRHDRDVTVRRLAWTNLGGSGTTVYTVQGPLTLWTLVPTANGLYAIGMPGVRTGDPALWRLGSGAAHALRPIAEYPSGFATIPPFAG